MHHITNTDTQHYVSEVSIVSVQYALVHIQIDVHTLT